MSTGAKMPASRQRRSQRESVHFRQSEVEYYRIILLSVREEIGLLSIAGTVDRVSSSAERIRQLPGQK